MAGRKRELGAPAQHVAANVRRIRQAQGISYAGLARRLAALGHPILDTGIMKIEKEERRVDVDDLVALAEALEVTAPDLLLGEVSVTIAVPPQCGDGDTCGRSGS